MAGASEDESAKSIKMEQEVDHEFVHRLDQIIEHNAVGIGLAIGYRVGLIKIMTELEDPKTSNEIAEKAGLHERCLRVLLLFFPSRFCD